MKNKKGSISKRTKKVIAEYLKSIGTTGLKTNPQKLSPRDKLRDDLLLEDEEITGLSLALDKEFLSEYQPEVVSDRNIGDARTVRDVIKHITDLLPKG